MILIFTEKEDIHPTLVLNYLNRKGVPVLRVNTDSLLVDYNLTIEQKNDLFLDDITLTSTGISIKSETIHSIWERRPVNPNKYNGLDDKSIRDHCLKEAGTFLGYLRYYYYDIFFIGHPIYDKLASSKLYQCKIASSLGMRYPHTIFSNSPNDIKSFSKLYKNVIIKAIQGDGVLMEEQLFPLYSSLANYEQIVELSNDSFIHSISFIQEYIPKAFELRVTVVCGEIFACKIDSQLLSEDTGKIDWRQGYDYGLKHEVFDLPNEIQEFCKSYLIKMKLNFGCFDFIVTPDNQYVFLECNPNGQWLWIEEEIGLPISVAIAEALIRGSW